MREAKPDAQGKNATQRMRAVEDERIAAAKARIAAGNRAANQTLCLLAYADECSKPLAEFRITFAHIKLEQHLNLRNRGVGQDPL